MDTVVTATSQREEKTSTYIQLDAGVKANQNYNVLKSYFLIKIALSKNSQMMKKFKIHILGHLLQRYFAQLLKTF